MLTGQAAGRRQPRAARSTPRRRTPPTRPWATSAAPSSPSTPRPARSSRWSSTREYDPGSAQPPRQQARSSGGLEGAQRRPRPSRSSTAPSPATSTRRARPSRSSRPPPRCRRQVHRGDPDPRPGHPGPAPDRRRPAQRRQAAVRAEQPDHPQARPRDLLQHRLRLARHAGRGRATSAPRPRSSAWATASDPHAGHAERVPAELNKPQLAQSAIGQYDVRVTPLQVAMVRAGDRQRRRRHEALPRQAGASAPTWTPSTSASPGSCPRPWRPTTPAR